METLTPRGLFVNRMNRQSTRNYDSTELSVEVLQFDMFCPVTASTLAQKINHPGNFYIIRLYAWPH